MDPVYDPTRCGDIRRMGSTVWVCICPRDNHPSHCVCSVAPDGMSHHYVNQAAVT